MLTEIDRELNDTHLPKDKLTLTRVLNYLAAGKKANGQAWTIRDAVKAVEVEDMGHASYYAKRYVEGKLPSDKFREIFGDETFKKLNKEQILLLKNADKIAKSSAAPADVPAAETPRKRSLSRTKGSEGMSERMATAASILGRDLVPKFRPTRDNSPGPSLKARSKRYVVV